MENKDFNTIEAFLNVITPVGESKVAKSLNFRFIVNCLVIGMTPQETSDALKEQTGEEINRQDIHRYRENYLDDDEVFQKAQELHQNANTGKITVQTIDEYQWLMGLMTRSRQNLSEKEQDKLDAEIDRACRLIDTLRKLKQEKDAERQAQSITGHQELDDEVLAIAGTCTVDGKFSKDLFEARIQDSLLGGELHRILSKRNAGKLL